jgi:hypothetical protein
MARPLLLDFRDDVTLHYDIGRRKIRSWFGPRRSDALMVQIHNGDRSRDLLLLLTEGQAESLLLLLLETLPEVGTGNREDLLTQASIVLKREGG